MSSMAGMSALSSGTIPAGFFGGRTRAPDRDQTALPYDAFAAIDPLGDDDDNGYADDDSTTSTSSSNGGGGDNDYDRNDRQMGDRDGGGAYDDGRTGRRHGADRGRKSALRGRDPYFGGIAQEAPATGGDVRGGLSADLGIGSSSSRFACPAASVQPDRRARHANGFGSVSRDMRRSSSGGGGGGFAASPTSPMLMASPLVAYERASAAPRSARDHQADLVDARRAYVDAVDQLGQRQRAYEAEREERIRQMDAQANLMMAPLREAAADAEDRMRTAARALQRQFDRRLVELEADRTLTHEARAAQRAAVERARAAALHPDDLYERRQREAPSAAGLLSMVDSLLGGIMGAGSSAPFVTVRMVPPSDASPMGPPPPSSSSSSSARRMAGAAARAQSPPVAPTSSSVRIEEID
ncbi:hypothetical protein pdul_cds_195 [Pandoravirus dulcis]|uniref:Uncharacterized protein n=1 Tax=Pandoravirus dulcis TaxID=1349409 RepID=S4VVK7_9VIRU|nr:hypothetical protein pdul_cds_195 [Pandoravirus dulcis]AGO82131.2 hypothetical protein pdul_cds_195 [Pandoravirus dulcis]